MRRKGFTLVEILVAVTILAVIGVIAARTLAAIASTAGALRESRARLAGVEMFFAVLGRDLLEILPERLEFGGDTVEPFSVDSGPEPSFGLLRAGSADGRPLPGPVLVRYRLADGALRREVSFVQGVDASGGRALLRGVRSMRVIPIPAAGAGADAGEDDVPRVPAGLRVEVDVDGLGRVSRLLCIGTR